MNPLARLIIEAGPLAAFFIANSQAGIMTGTAVFMAATTVSVLVSWHVERKVPVMPVVGAGFVMLFGGLTLWLNDDLFIKLKPTLVNLLFATVLFTAHILRRNVLKHLLGAVMALTEEGWRILGIRWAWFFVVLAVLNEVVWRSMTTDAWVNFKVFGIMPLTLLFSALQTPTILRHQIPEGTAAGTKASDKADEAARP
ncbi:septation protein A [Azospirillum sp. RWY-5-1]|uniref:Inner membrane-spanning protein YciB n=1 Tax=Azospirillum oleiclasticum TaxID=2735135 RepID=A0ABX2THS8_9PROT|nr:septation protein A [Azospirillum oleiclasticum]NYZ16319.1 septation protein A [Azospirillum oleiclasticum]NYZ23806.1 septation protein A [Azospirillum oleiclasticum]